MPPGDNGDEEENNADDESKIEERTHSLGTKTSEINSGEVHESKKLDILKEKQKSSSVGAVAMPGILASRQRSDVPEVEEIDFPDDQPDGFSDDAVESLSAGFSLSTSDPASGNSNNPLVGPELAPVDFPDARANITPGGTEGGYSDNFQTSNLGSFHPTQAESDDNPDHTSVTEHSLVETSVIEPPFNPMPERVDVDPDNTNINEHPREETSISETPINQISTAEEDQHQNNEDWSGMIVSQFQQQDPLLPLVSARLVEESSESSGDSPRELVFENDVVVVAKPLEREHFCRVLRRSRAALLGAAVMLLLVVGLVIGFGVTLGTKKPEAETKKFIQSPTIAPLPLSELRDVIVATFPSAAKTLEEDEFSSSPRRKALQWLSEDPSIFDYDEKRILQRWILATFFYSMSGKSWKFGAGWLGTKNGTDVTENECLWKGLSCDQTDNVTSGISSISMEGNNLNGTLPPEIGWFNESLKYIQLKDNNLNGSIPTECGLLKRLKRITLRINDLTGTIPTEIGLLERLSHFRVDKNELTGTIPSEIGMLKNSMHILLKNNKLCGDMPQEICKLRSLQLETLEADCKGETKTIKCTCCTRCWKGSNYNCSSKNDS